MVDYSKWDQVDISDEEDNKEKLQVHRFDTPQSVIIGGSKDGEINISRSSANEIKAPERFDDEPMEPADEELDCVGSEDDLREDVLQCRALAERALRRGDSAEGIRLLEKAMRLDGGRCPGLEDLLQSARNHSAGAIPLPPGAKEQDARRANGGTVGDRYCWSQTRDTVQVNVFVPEST